MKRTVATLLTGLGIILAGAMQTAAHNRVKAHHARTTVSASSVQAPLVSHTHLFRRSL